MVAMLSSTVVFLALVRSRAATPMPSSFSRRVPLFLTSALVSSTSHSYSQPVLTVTGPNQIEGVHCNGGCTLNNVVWDAVCEDAFSIKKQEDGETTTINGGGAKGAEDKVIQHNGGGTVIIK